jgi:hypothetical protein
LGNHNIQLAYQSFDSNVLKNLKKIYIQGETHQSNFTAINETVKFIVPQKYIEYYKINWNKGSYYVEGNEDEPYTFD